MIRKISRFDLCPVEHIKKPIMKHYRGGKHGYLWCTVDYGPITETGYCALETAEDCCDAAAKKYENGYYSVEFCYCE